MAIKFCTECGARHEYKFSLPKFCSNCGAPMGVANASEPTHQKKVSKKITALNDNETDAEYVPSLTKLEYEIDDFGTSLQQTMGSLAGKQAPKRRINKIRDINDL
jgi:hypothetical protein